MSCKGSFFLLILLLPLARCGSYEFTIYFYHYEISNGNCNSTKVEIDINIVNQTTEVLATSTIPTENPSSNVCHFQIGYDVRLNRMNPVILDHIISKNGTDMYLNIEFFKTENKSSTTVFSLDQVMLHANYTERRRYRSSDSIVSLDLSIQKNCSSEMEGETCNDPVRKSMLSALGLKLVLVLCTLVSVLLIIIIVIILLCCYNVRAAITAKANCKPMWFNRYFLDPKESRKGNSDPENGSSTRSRHNTRLTLINGSLYFWRSAGHKSKEQKKKSSLLDPTESKNKDPEVDDESKDAKEPLSLIVKGGHNIYEDYEEDGTWLAASHLSSEATEKATLSGEEKKEKKDQEFPASPTTKISETREKGKVSKVELKTNIKKDPKKKKSMDVDDLEQKTKANTKHKKMSLEVIPEDESATLKKRKKKEKKKKISSNDTKGVEESSVVKNIGAHFEEKSMPDSKEPIIVLVDNHEYEEHEADGTKLATSQPSKRLSADVKNLISKIESQSALVMSTGSGNMARASVTSDGSDEIIPLSKGGLSSTALLGRSASPKPGKLARASATSDGSDEIIPLSKGGLSSTALLGRAASPKPGRKDPKPSAGPRESNTHPKKEEVQSTFAGRVKASITKAFGQRKPIDMEEMERRIRENAKPKSSFEEDNEGSSSKKNKKKNKKKASMPDEEDRDGYISVDIKPSAKAERDEVVGKDGYVDIKTVALRKTKKLVESSDHSDEKDGYVPVEMPVEQSQSTSTALKRARDDSILTKPNSAYGIEKFSSTNSGDGVKFKSTGVKGHNLTDSRSSTPDGDYPYEYIRDQSIIKLRKKK